MKIRRLVILLLSLSPLFLKAQSGCSDPTAPNYYCNTAFDCVFSGMGPGGAPIFSLPAGFVDDGSCLYYGCTNSLADNYDSNANTDDGSCEFSGCTDDGLQNWSVSPGEAACNYDSLATLNDGTCTYPLTYYDCDNNCLNDTDGDGVCDELEVLGCTDSNAFSGYNPNATDDDGSCIAVVEGCMDDSAYNYDSTANTYDGSCCFIAGCTDNSMFNYNSSACHDDGSCIPFIYGCTLSLIHI